MAFQDFDQITERRQNYRKQRIKKRIIIGSAVTVVLLIIAAVVGLVLHSDNKEASSSSSSNQKEHSPESPNPVQKEVKAVCATTDFKTTCEDKLLKALGKNDSPTLNDFAKAALSAPSDEIKKALKKASALKYDGAPLKQAAVEDCLELLNDAVAELNKSIAGVRGMDLSKQSGKLADLKNQMSAALAHQETCIDGFPDGKEKSEMQKLLKDAKVLSRNALAIVSGAGSTVKGSGAQRRLFSLDGNGIGRSMKEDDKNEKAPDATVAKDGSGKFDTISAALKAMPKVRSGRYVIYVKEGVYEENIVIDNEMVNLTIRGDGSEKTIVSGSKSYGDGVTVYRSATFAVQGDGFLAKSIGFRNTAAPEKKQAVALRVQADRSMFIECKIEGHQNVLFTQSHRQFYRSCDIAGAADIIFGDAAAVFQNCVIKVRKPLENQSSTVTAQARVDRRETTGIVIQNSHIVADDDLEPEKKKYKSYLGRPEKEFSRAVVMESQIGDLIQPEGWLEEKGVNNSGVYLAEFENKGAGAETSGRVKWPGHKVIGKEEAAKFTVSAFLQGESWTKSPGVPVRMGLYN
ncbi:putative pectinesterase/pectinesterase inhibitor 45 [Andrographis paniculata]|uniref:putative pectinesterase/pectinesterase inhibitor 45 n=1 Tax=Andrographis paniculata TaxID=175694 RepID=UPI0021E6DE20|nr:putative pectinesterase/pectinesterase inhibitor 45 [Andrographis paniculata]